MMAARRRKNNLILTVVALLSHAVLADADYRFCMRATHWRNSDGVKINGDDCDWRGGGQCDTSLTIDIGQVRKKYSGDDTFSISEPSRACVSVIGTTLNSKPTISINAIDEDGGLNKDDLIFNGQLFNNLLVFRLLDLTAIEKSASVELTSRLKLSFKYTLTYTYTSDDKECVSCGDNCLRCTDAGCDKDHPTPLFFPGVQVSISGNDLLGIKDFDLAGTTISANREELIFKSISISNARIALLGKPEGALVLKIKNQDGADGRGSLGAEFSTDIYFVETCQGYPNPSSFPCLSEDPNVAGRCAFGTGEACRACPANAKCPGGKRAWTKPGYWNVDPTSPVVMECKPPKEIRCLGYNSTTELAECGKGYHGYACASCSKGYFMTDTGACNQCPENSLLSGLARPILMIFGYVCGSFAALLIILLLLTVKYEPKISELVVDCALLMLELIVMLQLVAQSMTGRTLIGSLDWLGSLFSAIMLESDDVHLECLGDDPFFSRKLQFIVVLGFFTIGLFLQVSFCKPEILCKMGESNPSSCTGRLYHLFSRFVTPRIRFGISAILVLSYVSVLRGIVSTIYCVYSPDGSLRLYDNNDIICYSNSKHFLVAVIAWATFAVYTVGYPIMTFFHVRKRYFGKSILWDIKWLLWKFKCLKESPSEPEDSIYNQSMNKTSNDARHRRRGALKSEKVAIYTIVFGFWIDSDYRKDRFYFRHIYWIPLSALLVARYMSASGMQLHALILSETILLLYAALNVCFPPYREESKWLLHTNLASITQSMLNCVFVYLDDSSATFARQFSLIVLISFICLLVGVSSVFIYIKVQEAKRRYLEAKARALEDDDEEDGFAIGGFEIPTLRKKQDGSFSMANPLRNGGKDGADRKKKKKKKKKKKFWDRSKGDDSSDSDSDSPAVAFGADELSHSPQLSFQMQLSNINAEADDQTFLRRIARRVQDHGVCTMTGSDRESYERRSKLRVISRTGHWVRMQDLKSSKEFYWNSIDRSLQLQRPPAIVVRSAMSEEEKVQNMLSKIRPHHLFNVISVLARVSSDSEETTRWFEVTDPETARKAYYDPKTDTIQLEKPENIYRLCV
eukprot:g2443.t1